MGFSIQLCEELMVKINLVCITGQFDTTLHLYVYIQSNNAHVLVSKLKSAFWGQLNAKNKPIKLISSNSKYHFNEHVEKLFNSAFYKV